MNSHAVCMDSLDSLDDTGACPIDRQSATIGMTKETIFNHALLYGRVDEWSSSWDT